MTNGDSTVGTLRQTALGGDVLAWRDALNEGPVPALPADRLREVRAAFLAACGWGSRREILDGERRDDLFARALAERRHVVLWFEHDLYDQLQLLQILALVGEIGRDPERLELICVGAFDGRPDFHGLGELTADELESLWPARRPVTDELVELGRLGWDAVRAPEPTAVEAFLRRDTAPLPFLAPELRRLLEELPDVESGLSRGERQLLEALADGPKTRVQAFLASMEREEAPFEGDAWVWRRLAALRPRVEGSAELALTDAGREVLAGAADQIDLLGIDRWVGGTHLRPGNLWRWDRSAGRVVAD